MARECCGFFKDSKEDFLPHLYVRGIDGKGNAIPLRTPIDFIEFKSEVARECGLLVDDFHLVYYGKLLDQEILEREHIEIFKWGTPIHLVLRHKDHSYDEARESSSCSNSCGLM